MDTATYTKTKGLARYAREAAKASGRNASVLARTPAAQLTQRMSGYRKQGHLVLCATLSTLVTSDGFAHSEPFSQMWTKHFVDKLHKRVPAKSRGTLIDHEYMIQRSPEGYWHFHGFVAVHHSVADRFWLNGILNRHLAKDLLSFRKAGEYRSCRINSFLIEPVEKTGAWTTYISREPDSKSSFD
jgi:hypothetical protein